MKEVTIITGFFDIGRDQYNFFTRGVDKYLQYFRFWARIRNQLIIYTQPELSSKIMDIRREFGLEDKTIIIEVPDIFSIEAKLHDRMKMVENNPEFLHFRANSKAGWPENMANYDYITLMKFWIIQDAVDRKLAEGLLAWIDFGFNHGGKVYPNPNEFDFLFECDLNPNKVHIFCLNNPDHILSVFQLQFLYECLMGCIFFVPSKHAKELWHLTKKAAEALLMLDCIDDDQQIVLMAYRENPEIFEVHLSDWFLPLKEHGGSHLTTKTKEIPKKSFITTNMINKKRLEFSKRIYEAAKKYQM